MLSEGVPDADTVKVVIPPAPANCITKEPDALPDPITPKEDVIEDAAKPTPLLKFTLALGTATPTTLNPVPDPECMSENAPGMLYPPSCKIRTTVTVLAFFK